MANIDFSLIQARLPIKNEAIMAILHHVPLMAAVLSGRGYDR